jgi:hypothetical protein
VESSHPADYVHFVPPDAFVDPGTVGVGVLYTFTGGDTEMLPPTSSGRVADLRVCVQPSAPDGPHSVSILEAAERATSTGATAWGTSYGIYAEGVHFQGTPAIGPPGTVTVRGPPVAAVACDVPSTPPGPDILFHISAPAAVSAGAHFDVSVEVATDTALGGLSFALDLDESVVQPVALTPATTWDAHSPFMRFDFSPSDGTVGFAMISDLIEGLDRILPGTNKLADIRLQVLPAAAGETTLAFAEQVDIDGRRYKNQATVNGSGADFDTEPLTVDVLSLKGAALAIVREAAFLRGDADGNESVDIADAIAVLGHLFRGQPSLPCHDAADADDSGVLDITDALHVLGFLFLGRAEPPAPGPYTPGVDPTEDDLSCLQGS